MTDANHEADYSSAEGDRHGFRCSDDARSRGDRSAGTAPPARNWFLVEQDGGWAATAWAGLDMADDAKEQLQEVLEDAEARLMLIRRPGRSGDDDASGRRWCVIQKQTAGEPRVVWGRAATDADLVAAAGLFADPETAVERIADPGAGLPGPRILLVCTHGRKDVCCAVRGRPVAARAAELWPNAAWECTHTGGDRFAGNLIVLPDGACYGGLDPDDVEGIVTAHVEGRIEPGHLRGPSGHRPPVQAAMVAAYARFAPLAFDAVTPVDHTGDPDRWAVTLDVRGTGRVVVDGHTEVTEPEFLTCKAGVRKVMHLPIVDHILVTDGTPI